MFNPKLFDIDSMGVHEILFRSIVKTDADLKVDLSKNIILTGGNSSFPGMIERLNKELNNL